MIDCRYMALIGESVETEIDRLISAQSEDESKPNYISALYRLMKMELYMAMLRDMPDIPVTPRCKGNLQVAYNKLRRELLPLPDETATCS